MSFNLVEPQPDAVIDCLNTLLYVLFSIADVFTLNITADRYPNESIKIRDTKYEENLKQFNSFKSSMSQLKNEFDAYNAPKESKKTDESNDTIAPKYNRSQGM